jgi:hypothetical protein
MVRFSVDQGSTQSGRDNMGILSFRRKSDETQGSIAIRDWSQQEMADFYRAHQLLVQNGVGIGMDRGLTDIGEPWMAFFDTASQDVFMHVARIDHKCILVCDQLALRISAASVSELITSFEKEVCKIISVRQNRASNVVLHPAARIIMSISAVFLLFKLENGSVAHAKEGEGGLAGELAQRKHEDTTARAQTVLARLYELVDSPAAIATLAGVILSLEVSSLNAAHPQDVVAHESHNLIQINLPAEADLDFAHIQEDMVEHIITSSGLLIDAAYVHQQGIDVSIDIASIPAAIEVAALGMAPLPDRPVDMTASAPVTSTTDASAAAPAAPVASSARAPVQAIVLTPKAQDSSSLITEQSPTETPALAVQVVQILIDTLSDQHPVSVALEAIKGGIGAISLATLDDVSAKVGFYEETELSGAVLSSALSYFMEASSYEVEFTTSHVLLELGNLSGLNADQVGIWSNVMSDGSTISVIGHIDLIDDVLALFS